MGHRLPPASVCQPIHILQEVLRSHFVYPLLVVLYAAEDTFVDDCKFVCCIFFECRLLVVKILENRICADNAAMVDALEELS